MRGSLSTKRKFVRYLIVIAVIIASGAFVSLILSSRGNSSGTEKKEVLKSANAIKDIQKEFSISLLDEKGKEINGVTMRLENVELREEIIVQGQKASSLPGRAFLVVNMKIVNSLSQAIEVNTKDYLRLEMKENEWLAPDIHNDPVLVQAISTKPTRVAFPVDSNLNRFALQVGEIKKDKEKLEIDFSK